MGFRSNILLPILSVFVLGLRDSVQSSHAEFSDIDDAGWGGFREGEAEPPREREKEKRKEKDLHVQELSCTSPEHVLDMSCSCPRVPVSGPKPIFVRTPIPPK